MTITPRDLAITAGITAGLAIIIILLFITLYGRGNVQDKEAQDLINQIKKQGLDKEGVPLSETEQGEEFQETEVTYSGRLADHIKGERVALTTNSGEVIILINEGTQILINSQNAQEEVLSIGDLIQVTATKKKDGSIVAKLIQVTRSTNPEVPSNLSEPAIQPPAIESRPISPY